MQQPNEHYMPINGANICWFEWGQANDQPSILLIHATGFHARCWDEVIKHLEGRHVIAIDMRGHGRSSKEGPVEWDVYAQDLVELVGALPLNQPKLVGHSMGGYCVTRSLAELSKSVDSALLIDPVVFDPVAYGRASHHQAFLDDAADHPVARRRNQFVDQDAMYANFEGRGSYASWRPEALRDYCQYGLLPDEDNGGFKLACPPHIEASIYMSSQSKPITDFLGDIEVPVTVLRAKQREEESMTMDFTKSPTWPELAAQFKNGRDIYLPELTHFMPMQAPELVADYVLDKQ